MIKIPITETTTVRRLIARLLAVDDLDAKISGLQFVEAIKSPIDKGHLGPPLKHFWVEIVIE